MIHLADLEPVLPGRSSAPSGSGAKASRRFRIEAQASPRGGGWSAHCWVPWPALLGRVLPDESFRRRSFRARSLRPPRLFRIVVPARPVRCVPRFNVRLAAAGDRVVNLAGTSAVSIMERLASGSSKLLFPVGVFIQKEIALLGLGEACSTWNRSKEIRRVLIAVVQRVAIV